MAAGARLSTITAVVLFGQVDAAALADAAQAPATITKIEAATSIDRSGHQNIELINGSAVKQTIHLHESLVAGSAQIAIHSAVTVKARTSGIITVELTAGARHSLSKTGAELKVKLVAVCTSASQRSTTVNEHITLRRAT